MIRPGHELVQEEGKAQTHQQRGSPSGGVQFCNNKKIFCFSLVDEVRWEGIRHICQLKLENNKVFPPKKRCTKGITNKVANSHPAPMGKNNSHSTNRHFKVWVGTGQGWKQLSLFYAVDSFLEAIMQVKLLLKRVKTHAFTGWELAMETAWAEAVRRHPGGTHQETGPLYNGKSKGKKPKRQRLENSKRWVTITTEFWEKSTLEIVRNKMTISEFS